MNNFGLHFVNFLGNIMNYVFGPLDSLIDKLPLVDYVKDALIDSVHMIPFLLFIFIIIELLEYYFADRINKRIKKAEKSGPLVGSLLACIPQCGFSVVASTLYTRKLLTIGTLIAVYLSTSDEAIPVILAMPDKMNFVMQLLFIKVMIAVIAGYIIDTMLKSYDDNTDAEILSSEQNSHSLQAANKLEFSENIAGSTATITYPEITGNITKPNCKNSSEGCCGHHLNSQKSKLEFFTHPLAHTIKIVLFVFLVTLAINYIIFKVGGEENLGMLLLQHSLFQPILTALVGLIPNCASSVAITLVYLKGGIGFGSLISGLCASAGLGLLILFRENKNLKDSFRVLGLLLLVSMTVGIIVQYLYN